MIKPPAVIEYYYDEECTNRVPVNELGFALVDWGKTIPGTKKEKTIYVKSLIADRIIFIQPNTGDTDLRIINFPANLLEKEVGKISLEFEPNQYRVKPLNAGWGFDLIIG